MENLVQDKLFLDACLVGSGQARTTQAPFCKAKRQDTIATMIPCLCFLRMALTYIVPVRYCMNRGSANGAPAGRAFLVDIPTEAVAKVRGLDELRLLIFPQPLDGALKNQNAAPASPPCFRRRRRSAPLLFESTLASPFSRQIKQKLRYPLDTGVLGGRGWIRTTEAESSRFTVCPHWPLGNTPIFIFTVAWTACICYH